MTNQRGREALRGVDTETVVVHTVYLSSKQRQLKALLEDPLARAADGQGAAVILDAIAEVLTPEKWAELLQDILTFVGSQGMRGFAQRLVTAGSNTRDALHAAVFGGYGEAVEICWRTGGRHRRSGQQWQDRSPLRLW